MNNNVTVSHFWPCWLTAKNIIGKVYLTFQILLICHCEQSSTSMFKSFLIFSLEESCSPWTAFVGACLFERLSCSIGFLTILKAVFQLRVFYTYVHARKSLNLFQYYIWSKQMFWWREFSIPYDFACFSDFIC